MSRIETSDPAESSHGHQEETSLTNEQQPCDRVGNTNYSRSHISGQTGDQPSWATDPAIIQHNVYSHREPISGGYHATHTSAGLELPSPQSGSVLSGNLTPQGITHHGKRGEPSSLFWQTIITRLISRKRPIFGWCFPWTPRSNGGS